MAAAVDCHLAQLEADAASIPFLLTHNS
jgi:hypothetical protein